MENVYSNGNIDHSKSSNSRKRSPRQVPYFELYCDLATRFNFTTALICQINNCTARKLHPNSFSWELAQQFNYADPYQHRTSGPYPNLAAPACRPEPGSIEVLHPPTGTKGPSFACLYAQYKMGDWDSSYYLNARNADPHYKYMALRKDTYNHRLQYFKRSLSNLLYEIRSNPEKYSVIIFPKYIGCGLAKGNWEDYEKLIIEFCNDLKYTRPHTTVCVVNKNL